MKISWTDKNGKTHSMNLDRSLVITTMHGDKEVQFGITEYRTYDMEEGKSTTTGSIQVSKCGFNSNDLIIIPNGQGSVRIGQDTWKMKI